MTAKVLVIGGGGREHTICHTLAQSSKVSAIFVSPGNAGTSVTAKCSNISSFPSLASTCEWCKSNAIDLVFVGPEDPLANGISDHLEKNGILCFGPSAEAANIEASKSFSKDFMIKYGIPTARYQSFTDSKAAIDYIEKVDFLAWVVKANGLAAGKGVFVTNSNEEACAAVRMLLDEKAFGNAGSTIIVEEKIEGEELSCLAFCDGYRIKCMPPAQDHKRLLDGDLGPNTGGMGAYCPCSILTDEQFKFVKHEILQKTVDGLRLNGTPFKGILYAGIMLTKDGPRVLEFNCRFGDPETQVILPLMTSDLYDVAVACCTGNLGDVSVEFNLAHEQTAVCVVAVSKGYPGSFKKGLPISGLNTLSDPKCHIIHAGTQVDAEGHTVTNGGRVLGCVAIDTSISAANERALSHLKGISFEGIQFRRDIGFKAKHHDTGPNGDINGVASLTYAASGVSISAGENLVDLIKPMCSATMRPGCQTQLGLFGAVFDLKMAGYNNPLLVSGTDGVGTKIKLAQALNKLDTIGQDLVAMCVNDILCHAAEPLFFLDYFACGKLNPIETAKIVKGIADGCRLAGCALIGGETAEMPGMYNGGEFDLAGFAVGAVDSSHLLPRIDTVSQGDVLIGLPSSGLHSNGFSLVRKIIHTRGWKLEDPAPFNPSESLGSCLLEPTRIYSRSILSILRDSSLGIKGLAHITGGGLLNNIPRILPDNLGAVVDANTWKIPPLFIWLAQEGGLAVDEMCQTFNVGLGLVFVVQAEAAVRLLQSLRDVGEDPYVVGSVVPAGPVHRVTVTNVPQIVHTVRRPIKDCSQLIPVGVLISGSGTNLQALLDHCADPARKSLCRIAVVISNVPGVKGLERATKAGVNTQVVPHKNYSSREAFEEKIHSILSSHGCRLVCLAGFMRILTSYLVSRWRGKLINIHPSLLPSFKGAHAHRDVLKSGVRVSGASVHFVIEDVDAGAIISQATTHVHHADTEETLSNRVKNEVEHVIFPQAMELVATETCILKADNTVQWIE